MKKNFALLAFAALGFAALTVTGCKDPDPVKVSSISVTPANATLAIGGTKQLQAAVLPADADNKSVTWSSNKEDVATVNASTGLVTAVAEGTATITATAADGSGKTGIATITVSPAVSIDGDGIDEPLEIKATEAGEVPVVVDIAASKGIENFMVEIVSSSEAFMGGLAAMGITGEFDLANPGDLSVVLSGPAVGLPNGEAVKGETELEFDITAFIPKIFAVRAMGGEFGNCTVAFNMTVTDTEGASDEATINLNLIDFIDIAGDGFDIDEAQTVLFSEVQGKSVVVDIAALNGIDKLLVDINSTSAGFTGSLAMMGLGGEFDLANPSEEFMDALEHPLFGSVLQSSLPYGDAVKDKTELAFDISNFMTLMATFLAEGDFEASFVITVADADENSVTKTLTLEFVNDEIGE